MIERLARLDDAIVRRQKMPALVSKRRNRPVVELERDAERIKVDTAQILTVAPVEVAPALPVLSQSLFDLAGGASSDGGGRRVFGERRGIALRQNRTCRGCQDTCNRQRTKWSSHREPHVKGANTTSGSQLKRTRVVRQRQ